MFGTRKVRPSVHDVRGGHQSTGDVGKMREAFRMRVCRLDVMFELYGKRKHPKLSTFETLKEKGKLLDLDNVKSDDSTIIYVSHQWVGIDHPDPRGDHTYHLLLLLDRLRKGQVSRTDMAAFHSLVYKHNHTTTAKEWKHILHSEKTFIFYDGICVPREKRAEAFISIPAYIRRCDFMIILAPGCTHFSKLDTRTQRKMHLCYRTYRLSAMCVFEMFSSFLTTKGEEQVRPALLVRSGTGIPSWMSPLECQKLAIGTSMMECCENNHTIIKECRRSTYLKILDELIERRVRSLFSSNKYAEARFTFCFRNYWCRGLLSDTTEKSWNSLDEFKNDLQWDTSYDDTWIDREEFPLLAYTASSDCVDIVRQALAEIAKVADERKRKSLTVARVPNDGVVGLGITGGCTALIGAMMVSKSPTVCALLEHGANPYESDVNGNDPFMFACMFGRTENVKFWLKRFSDWDLERKNKIVGSVALGQAVYMGPHRLELVKVLLDAGASVTYRSDHGSSILTDLCSSEDTDPTVLQFLFENRILERRCVNSTRSTKRMTLK